MADITDRLDSVSSAQDWESLRYLIADASDEIRMLRTQLWQARQGRALLDLETERRIADTLVQSVRSALEVFTREMEGK